MSALARMAWYGALGVACVAGAAGGGGGNAATADSSARAGPRPAGAAPGAAGGSAAARQSEPPSTAASPGVPTVLSVAARLTAGLGLDPEEAFPQRVAERAAAAGDSIRIVNAGLSG